MPTSHAAELPEGPLPTDRTGAADVVVYSLTAHAICAMDRHKWIESEKAGRDLGEGVHKDWIDRFWKGWTRSKLMEHLYGWRCWGAFEEEDFALLTRATVDYHVPRAVLLAVAGILGEGGENLDVIAWAQAGNHDLDQILWLLDRIDINAKRHRLLTDHIRLFIDRSQP